VSTPTLNVQEVLEGGAMLHNPCMGHQYLNLRAGLLTSFGSAPKVVIHKVLEPVAGQETDR